MSTIIILTLLGVLVLMLGALKMQRWLLPVLLSGLTIAFFLTISVWNHEQSFFHKMLVMDKPAIAFSASLIGFTLLIMLFSSRYYKGVQRSLDDIYGVLVLGLVGAVLMTSFGNMILLFLGIETLSIALYVLAGSHKEAITSNEATLKYFLLGSFLSGFLLFGIALIYGASGSFSLDEIHDYIVKQEGRLPALFQAGLYLLIAGLAFKIAIVPFHFWAPDVYEGTPTLLTAYMATVVKTASIMALFRFLGSVFSGIQAGEWQMTIAVMAALTIILGNFTGIYQPNMKRMLAYSSISHSGYMMLAVVAFSEATAGSLLLYAVSYSLATITSFGILILIRETYGNDHFSSFNGFAKTNPVEAFCLTVAMLSLAGIPPLAGFMAKFYLFSTTIGSGFLWLALVAILGSAVSVVFYFKPVVAMYLKDHPGQHVHVTWPYRVSLILMTILMIILGIAPVVLTTLI